MSDLAVQEVPDLPAERGAVQLLIDLEAAGAADEVSLVLTDPDMPYERWEDLGRFLGSIDKRSRWYIGDWLNFGEAVYGESAAQGVEATTSERYSEAERVTGLDHGTLMNIRSVCAKVPRENRRKDLGFWIHSEVAKLDAAEQPRWLDAAIENGWSKTDLRDAIRAEKNPPAEDDSDGDGEGGAPPAPTASEKIEEAANVVVDSWSLNSDGEWVVPKEAGAKLLAALGRE